MSIRGAPLAWLLVASLLACSKQSRECEKELESAQKVVLDVDQKSLDSVQTSLLAVERAHAACEKAERWDERNELAKARNQLRAHYASLQRKAADPTRRDLTPEELDKLAKDGDATCPRGQGYKHRASNQEIRCVGPQVVEMGYTAARDYFDKRGYKIMEEPPATLKAEYGAERFEMTYETPNDSKAPLCFVIFPKPEMSWEEATARMTGVPPHRLKPSGTVPTRDGPRPLLVQAGETKSLIRIGDCGGAR